MVNFTVDDAENTPEQENHDNGGGLFTVWDFSDAVQKHHIKYKRRYDDERVKDLHATS